MTRKKYKKLVRKFLTDFYSKYPIEKKPGLIIKDAMKNIDNGAILEGRSYEEVMKKFGYYMNRLGKK